MKTQFGPYRILSLSGGGFKGLYTAEVLAQLEYRLGRPLCECFDLVAGTSVGGILALGVAAGVPAAALAKQIREAGPRIFGGGRPPPQTTINRLTTLLGNLRSTKYAADELRVAIAAMIGETTTWADLKTDLLVTAVSLLSGSPQIFSSYTLPKIARDAPLIQVALATSAAPTYFPTAMVGSSSYVDGGLAANAPDLVALIETETTIGIARERLCIVAVGTTKPIMGDASLSAEARGIADWRYGRKIVDLVLTSQVRLTRDLTAKLLEDRYWVLDREISHEQALKLDFDSASVDASDLLCALAQETIDQAHFPPWLMATQKAIGLRQ